MPLRRTCFNAFFGIGTMFAARGRGHIPGRARARVARSIKKDHVGDRYSERMSRVGRVTHKTLSELFPSQKPFFDLMFAGL